MVGQIRPLNESGQKNLLCVLCELERPAGAGERKKKPSFPRSKAEGLWN
jgi:hypothetical protein